jgi:hypothetical protein
MASQIQNTQSTDKGNGSMDGPLWLAESSDT